MSLATNQPVKTPYPARYLAARLVLDELQCDHTWRIRGAKQITDIRDDREAQP